MNKTKVIAITNFKGGAGKTTVAVNLSYSLSSKGFKVLLIDSDMQMNSTNTLNKKQDTKNSIYNALIEEKDFTKYIQRTEYDNLDIIISDYEMAYIDLDLFPKMQREIIFKKLLKTIREDNKYDFIIIDTNPSLGLVNQNVMIASDYALIPVELSKYGIQGLATLTRFFKKAVIGINEDFKILGVVLNKVHKGKGITKVATDVIRDVFNDLLLETSIGIDTNIEKAQWNDKPVVVYDKNSRASKQIGDLANEVIKIVK